MNYYINETISVETRTSTKISTTKKNYYIQYKTIVNQQPLTKREKFYICSEQVVANDKKIEFEF